MQPKLFHLHALSALHCGTGQSAGVVDLPIARDRASNLPLVPGSSLRGVLREEFTGRDEALAKTLFGPRTRAAIDSAYAGALAVGDAHLLLLPVRALAGIVAYATCPFILRRYARDAGKIIAAIPIPQPGPTEAFHATANQNQVMGKIVLEELDLTPTHREEADRWAGAIAKAVFPDDKEAQDDLVQRFLILPDSVFSFLADTATEIRTRIAINPQTGTVDKDRGALWYEENLPAESLLWGVYALSRSRVDGEQCTADELSAKFCDIPLLQLGGKAGVGRGLTRFLHGGAP